MLICNTDDYAAVNGLDGKDVQAGDDVIIITENSKRYSKKAQNIRKNNLINVFCLVMSGLK